jgi:hypothetical protein
MLRNIFLISFCILFFGCTNSKKITEYPIDSEEIGLITENENIIDVNFTRIDKEDEIESNIRQINMIFYVSPPNGLTLRVEPSPAGTRIRGLPQFERLEANAMTNKKETIDGINDFWYRVNTDGETGWVFGGYLISDLSNNNVVLERPVLSEDQRYFEFTNGQRINIWDDDSSKISYYIDNIRVYNETAKTSDNFEINDKFVGFYKIDGNDDWLYLRCTSTDEWTINGFVYIYDIPESGFYRYMGNRTGELGFIRSEYDIIQNFGNISRFGPILMVHYDYRIIRFGDSFKGETGNSDHIIGYFPEYDEILIATSIFPNDTNVSLYDLRLNRYVLEDIGYPSFSPSRKYIVSLYQPDIWFDEYSLRVYCSRNDTYHIIKETENKYRIDLNRFRITDIVSWVNDNEVIIDMDGINNIVIYIKDDNAEILTN